MRMRDTQAVRHESGASPIGIDWARFQAHEAQECEALPCQEIRETADVAEVALSNLSEEWESDFEVTGVEPLAESAASADLDSSEFREALNDPDFRADLKQACTRVFYRYPQSTHASWEDLQQEVLMRFGKWLRRYRKEANRRTVFEKIAVNVLIDAKRRETANRRRHEEVNFDDLGIELIRERSGTEIEDRIYLNECRSILSETERLIFDDFFVNGESLRQIALLCGVSAPAIKKRFSRVIAKLHDHEKKGRTRCLGFPTKGAIPCMARTL